MEKVFAVSDIHGHAEQLKKLLELHWDKDNEKLVIMGDLIDRGPDSLGVISLCMELREKYDAVILMGNHEEMFLDWLDEPDEEGVFYYDIGGDKTIDSFFGDTAARKYFPKVLANEIKKKHSKEVEFLRNLPSYFEWDFYVFVHAGVNLYLENWRNSSERDFKWSRREFIYAKNMNVGRKFVFGHTNTSSLHPDFSNDIWVSTCGSKIGIDGDVCGKGELNGLLVTRNSIQQKNISKKPPS